jgi:hypothetical protein
MKLPPRSDVYYQEDYRAKVARAIETQEQGTGVRILYLLDGTVSAEVLPIPVRCSCGCGAETYFPYASWDDNLPLYSSRSCKQRAWRNAQRALARAKDQQLIDLTSEAAALAKQLAAERAQHAATLERLRIAEELTQSNQNPMEVASDPE